MSQVADEVKATQANRRTCSSQRSWDNSDLKTYQKTTPNAIDIVTWNKYNTSCLLVVAETRITVKGKHYETLKQTTNPITKHQA
jgi:hypothetical protein